MVEDTLTDEIANLRAAFLDAVPEARNDDRFPEMMGSPLSVVLYTTEYLKEVQKGQGVEQAEEIHNVWTIYGMDSLTEEAKQPLAAMGTRPQDWGDPRWTYHRFRFEWQTDPKGKPTAFHCHCWTDLKRKPHEYLSLFLPLFAYVSTTGRPPQLCGRDFLAEEDFWEKKWGKMPPIFEEESDDFGLEDIEAYG